MKFPNNWEERLLDAVPTGNWQETEKIKVLLRRAQEGKILLSMKENSRYVENREWIENLEDTSAFKAGNIKAVLRKKRKNLEVDLDSLDLPPTAGERVSSDVNNFVRVSEVLLLIAPELYFVDPFFNPLRSDHCDVFVAMLKTASSGAAKKIDAWTRKVEADDYEIRERLIDIKKRSGFKYPFNLYVVDDTCSQYKLHDRWLFTQFGGIGFSQGFQRQSKNRKTNVWPMDKQLLDDCWYNLREDNADFSKRCLTT